MTSDPMTDATPSSKHERAQMRRATVSSTLGFALEHYDFVLYGTMAALVFGPLFFGSTGWGGTAASFATFTVGYVARPLGGVIFGHFGDYLGRKKILLITVTMMAVSSTLIGLLPTYDQVGAAAPISLVTLRILQGFAMGGESGGSILLTAENSSPKRRGLWASAPLTGGPIGALLSSGVTAAALSLPDDQFNSWGWRIPFLLSVVLMGVALYIRSSVDETTSFKAAKSAQPKKIENPLKGVLRQPRVLLPCIAVGIGPQAINALIGAWLIAYGVQNGYDRQFLLIAVGVASAVVIVTLPLFGHLSDIFGRKQVMIAGGVTAIATAFPFMWMIDSGSAALLLIAVIWGRGVLQASMYAPWPALLAESFRTTNRYTGVSVSKEFATLVASGFTPLALSGVAATMDATTGVSIFIVGVGAITVLAASLTQVGREVDLDEVGVEPSAARLRTGLPEQAAPSGQA